MEKSKVGFTQRELVALLLLAAVQFVHIVDFMLLMPLEVNLDRSLKITSAQFAALVSAYTFAAGIGGILAAFFLDRFDRRSSLLLLLAGFIFGTIACGVSQSYSQLLLARILAGAFGGVINAVVYAIVGDLVPYERRGEAIGIVMMSFSAATVAGVPLSLYLAEQGGWQLPFLAISGFAAGIWLAVFLWLPKIRKHLEQLGQTDFYRLVRDYFSVLANPNHLRAYLVMITMMFAGFSVIPHISAYMVRNVGLAEWHLKYMYLSGGFATIFSLTIIGRMSDIYGKQRLFYFFATLSMIPLMTVTILPPVPLWWALLLTSLFFVLVSGRLVPAMALVTAVAEPHQRGNFMSLNSAIQQLAAGSAAWVAGNIIFKDSAGKVQNFHYVGLLAVLSTVGAIFAVSRLRRYEEIKAALTN